MTFAEAPQIEFHTDFIDHPDQVVSAKPLPVAINNFVECPNVTEVLSAEPFSELNLQKDDLEGSSETQTHDFHTTEVFETQDDENIEKKEQQGRRNASFAHVDNEILTMENTFVGKGMLVKEFYPETTKKQSINHVSTTKERDIQGFGDDNLLTDEKESTYNCKQQEDVCFVADRFDLESICRYQQSSDSLT